MNQNLPDYETKVNNNCEPGLENAFDEFMEAFEAFKETNDERLNRIEKRLSSDVVIEEKLERINRAIDQNKRNVDNIILKSKRPNLEYEVPDFSDESLRKSAFELYMRHGNDSELRKYERKSLSTGSDSDGGYLVPAETENAINSSLRGISPIRAIAGVRQVSGAIFKKPFSIAGPGTGWVGETEVRPETAASTLAELSFPTMELYAMPAATSALLDDSAVNVDEWISEEVRTAFAEQESTAFVTGDGNNKPRGFLDYQTVDNGSWSWGKLGHVGGFEPADPSDSLIDLIYALRSGYRANGHWIMNRSVQAEIRKIRDGDGNYIWQPSNQAGHLSTLMNYPIVESEDMPDAEPGNLPVAFGDFRRGYLIVDRIGIRVLRDPYSSKPYVLFYTTKRVGGGVQDFDAIKFVKYSND